MEPLFTTHLVPIQGSAPELLLAPYLVLFQGSTPDLPALVLLVNLTELGQIFQTRWDSKSQLASSILFLGFSFN